MRERGKGGTLHYLSSSSITTTPRSYLVIGSVASCFFPSSFYLSLYSSALFLSFFIFHLPAAGQRIRERESVDNIRQTKAQVAIIIILPHHHHHQSEESLSEFDAYTRLRL